MRKGTLFFAFFLFVSGLYAQTNLGIDYDELNKRVKDYWENTFKQYLNRSDLAVTDITSTTDWNRSSNNTDRLYFFSEGRFRNFSIDGRNLSGRVVSGIAVRRITNRGRVAYDINPDDQIDKIILLVDDLLSDELRDTMVKDYINQHYNRPLDINIQRSRLEIYPDDIYSYVSVVVNNNTIKYLRFLFQRNPPAVQSYDRIEIRQTSWVRKRADEIFSCSFPDTEQLRVDARDDLFAFFSNVYRSESAARGGFNVTADFQFTSGIRSNTITIKEPIEATEGFIKLPIEFQYQLGRLLQWSNYSAEAKITYQYDFQENRWHYISIQDIKY